MAVQIVMDHTGDTRHCFNSEDAQELMEAERRFKELTKVGLPPPFERLRGKSLKSVHFDPTAEETLFFPRLVGG